MTGPTLAEFFASQMGTRPGDDTRAAMTARRECERDGHRYQVHGKTSPNKVSCKRCRTSWAIGARTEPTT